jgi:hypothetical protein
MKSDFVCHYRVDGVMRIPFSGFPIDLIFCLSVLSCRPTIKFIGVPSGLRDGKKFLGICKCLVFNLRLRHRRNKKGSMLG